MAFTTAPPSDKKQNTIHRYQVSDAVHCDLNNVLCTVPSINLHDPPPLEIGASSQYFQDLISL